MSFFCGTSLWHAMDSPVGLTLRGKSGGNRHQFVPRVAIEPADVQIRRDIATSMIDQPGGRSALVGTLNSSRQQLHLALPTFSSSSGQTRNEWRGNYVTARAYPSAGASDTGQAENTEQLWETFFADPSQWWDHRAHKIDPKSPDFKHRLTKDSLWIDGRSNPPWVESMLITMTGAVTRGKVQSYRGSNVHMPHVIARSDHKWHRRTQMKKEEAVATLHKFDLRGILVDSSTYAEVLQKVSKMKDLGLVKQVHDHIIESGVEPNNYVFNNLLKAFIDCGSLVGAQQIFDKFSYKSIVSWNIMIGGSVRHGDYKKAHGLFLRMRQDGYKPNAITYLSILNACASPAALGQGTELRTHIINAKLESDVRLGNALVKMFGKCGSLQGAQQVFDRMATRNVISWTVMIGAYAESGFGDQAFELFLQMQQEGLEPNAITYMSILNPCAITGDSEWVKEVHIHAVKAGFESDVRVGSALVKMYAKSGNVEDGRKVFDRMLTRDPISWNVMIGAYTENGCGDEAFELFLQMQREGWEPDAVTYLSILSPCANAADLNWVREVHDKALKSGIASDVRVGSALINMYAKSGSLANALQAFSGIVKNDIISWTAMIGAYAECGFGDKAFELFLQIQQVGLVPNAVTYLSILNPRASTGALEWVKEVHSQALKVGLGLDGHVGNALINMYAKSGSIKDARKVFDRMATRDIFSWTVMIGAYAESGYGGKAFELFLQMQCEGFEPNAITYLRILNPCASAGALEWLREVHNEVLKVGLESDVRVGSALVNMYAKSGRIKDAQQVFDSMVVRNVVSWTVMIGGLAQHGCGQEALHLFEQMKREGLRPNEVTFVAVLSACSHAGLVDEGRHHFLSLSQDYGIKPTIEHYNCMVDILGRAGALDEAFNFIKSMALEANATTWGSLLGACRIHGNVKLAEDAANMCLKLEPENASVYVLLSNIYATAGMWEQVSLVRNMMNTRGVQKEPGQSWIEIDKKVHSFYAEDTSHPQSEEIYTKLRRLIKEIKKAGYVSDTQFVVHDIDEQHKGEALLFHSEKLAIAYGLITLPGDAPVRIFKNLRVCTDCHSATKFISKVARREIVARDASRFHHFKDGVCSCGDYW